MSLNKGMLATDGAGLLTSRLGGSMKSHVSDLLELAAHILNDAAAKCSVKPLLERDLLTLRSRVKHEGLSFLTITLPSLGSDFERCLNLERIDPLCFRSFRKHGKAPAFMQGFFGLVFDESGRMLDDVCISAIEGIRQMAYTFKKLEVACDPLRVRKTLRKFIQCEQDLNVFRFAPDNIASFSSISSILWGNMFGLDGSLLPLGQTIPKHGPGATADGLSGNAKFRLDRWHDRLEPYFPCLDYVFASASAYRSKEFERVKFIPEDQESPVKVIPVPKTLKGPRIIAIEPTCMQYAQQAVSADLVRSLESYYITRGHINFYDQQVNRKLAMSASMNGKFATLDLSSASDRVPYSLAINMFDTHPDLRDAISACRSKQARMPDGEVIPLLKFASMGSALCFPVEAMYFYTCCVVALIRSHDLPVSLRSIELVSKDIYVYGDDIIVPANVAEIVIETLQEYCCKVNTSKSHWNGLFRESCGMDAYAGYEVTPTYLRRLLPYDKQSAPELISAVASSNQFYRKGYWRTADFLTKVVERQLGKLPIVSERSSGLGWVSYQNGLSIDRWGKRFQRPEVRTMVDQSVYRRDQLDGYAALSKCLVRRDSSKVPERDAKHLVRTARHGADRKSVV